MAKKDVTMIGDTTSWDTTPETDTYTEYPKMIYHPEGQEKIVRDAIEHKAWEARGYLVDPPKQP